MNAARVWRWPKRIGLGLLVLIVASFIAIRVASRPIPEGRSGAEADALARRIEQSVAIDAWNETGAVRWSFMGRHEHFWDKRNNRHRVVWGEHEVVVDLGTRRGCARVAGKAAPAEEEKALLDKAFAYWANDAYWLNPLSKLFDPGVVRKLVQIPGERPALLITFTQNGLTPGDSYLWLLDAQARPRAFRMWTRIPIGGIEATWEAYRELDGGAWVSTRHSVFGLSFEITDVAAAVTAEALNNGRSPMSWCKVR